MIDSGRSRASNGPWRLPVQSMSPRARGMVNPPYRRDGTVLGVDELTSRNLAASLGLVHVSNPRTPVSVSVEARLISKHFDDARPQ
jgi:hypothetical protein